MNWGLARAGLIQVGYPRLVKILNHRILWRTYPGIRCFRAIVLHAMIVFSFNFAVDYPYKSFFDTTTCNFPIGTAATHSSRGGRVASTSTLIVDFPGCWIRYFFNIWETDR